MSEVVEKERPKLIDTPLLTRKEAAKALRLSEREWDRLRKKWPFSEVHILEGNRGLRFLSLEIEEYIWQHRNASTLPAPSAQ